MKIIEKIEIKHFRSFDGGFNQPKVEIIDIKDLNIFSGANDSGKSNILRALNLFFNNEILPGLPFDIGRDLSKLHKTRSADKVKSKRDKGSKDARQKDLWVKIKISFTKETSGVLPQKFWVERMWDKNGLHANKKHNIKRNVDEKKARAQEGQLTQFLNNIKFEYIPAVKDRQFFNFLFRKLQEYLFEKQDRKSENVFKNHSIGFNDLLRKETKKLFDEFKNNTNIEARFSIPETLVDFFRTLGVETENEVSLFDRGDGIQARFIPDILNEISRDSRRKIIWGFEEPENSYEPLRCFELAQDFVKYSKEKQIFITSHAFPFIALKGKNVSSYRVKNQNSASQIGTINWQQRSIPGLDIENNIDELEKEVGILETYSKLSEHLGREISKQKHCLFIEDKCQEIYKIAWLKFKNIQCDKNNFETLFQQESNFSIFSKGGKDELQKHLDQAVIEEFKDNKVIGIFDFDDAFNNFKGLNQSRWDPLEGSEASCLSRKRNDHSCFYAILIPVPISRKEYAERSFQHNYLALEHLFEDKALDNIGVLGVPDEPSGGKKIAKINRKKDLWEKIFALPTGDFQNFVPLFTRINELFGQ